MGEVVMNQSGRFADSPNANAAARQLEIPSQVGALQELSEVLSSRISMLEERLVSVTRPIGPEPGLRDKDPRVTTEEVHPVRTSLGDALYKQICQLRQTIERVEQITARLEV